LLAEQGQSINFAEQQLDYAIVIPALNEADGIGQVIDEINQTLSGQRYGILVVDGNSEDETCKIARQRGALVIFQKGKGYGDALRRGLLYVRHNMNTKVTVMMDADMTYDPENIPQLILPILQDRADMVVGERIGCLKDGAMTKTNQVGNKIISWFARRTLGIDIHDTQCGIRAFKTELIDDMSLLEEGMPFALEMIADAKAAKASIKEVTVNYRVRSGKTKLNPIKDGLRILGTLIRLIRDTEPMLFFVGTAGVLFLLSAVFGIGPALEWFSTHTIVKIPSLIIATLLMIGAIQFFTLGLVADMIKRSKHSRRF
jgi:dolichol-phosphate hexosyltransferase